MKPTTKEGILSLLKDSGVVRPRLLREIRITPEEVERFGAYELAALSTKSHQEGVLLLTLSGLRIVPFALTKKLTDKATGRTKPAICDLCFTYRRSGEIGVVTFPRKDRSTIGILCCADLACSQNVRDMTSAAQYSRTQLREDLTVVDRIARLRARLMALTERLER